MIPSRKVWGACHLGKAQPVMEMLGALERSQITWACYISKLFDRVVQLDFAGEREAVRETSTAGETSSSATLHRPHRMIQSRSQEKRNGMAPLASCRTAIPRV